MNSTVVAGKRHITCATAVLEPAGGLVTEGLNLNDIDPHILHSNPNGHIPTRPSCFLRCGNKQKDIHRPNSISTNVNVMSINAPRTSFLHRYYGNRKIEVSLTLSTTARSQPRGIRKAPSTLEKSHQTILHFTKTLTHNIHVGVYVLRSESTVKKQVSISTYQPVLVWIQLHLNRINKNLFNHSISIFSLLRALE